MKRAVSLVGLLTVTTVFLSSQSYGQGRMNWKGGGGWGPGSSYNRMFDPTTVETFSGKVLRVDKVAPMKGMSYGVRLTLKTHAGLVPVHAGPACYLENQDVKISPEDRIEVTGSRITFQGKPAIIAQEIRKENDTLKLRDANEFPRWSGWQRR